MEEISYKINQKKSSELTHKYQYFIVSIIVAMGNMVFCTSYLMSLGMVILEGTALIYYFLKKRYTDYICFYLIFMSLSLEFPYYYEVGELYGFKGTRIGGISIGSLFIFPI